MEVKLLSNLQPMQHVSECPFNTMNGIFKNHPHAPFRIHTNSYNSGIISNYCTASRTNSCTPTAHKKALPQIQHIRIYTQTNTRTKKPTQARAQNGAVSRSLHKRSPNPNMAATTATATTTTSIERQQQQRRRRTTQYHHHHPRCSAS